MNRRAVRIGLAIAACLSSACSTDAEPIAAAPVAQAASAIRGFAPRPGRARPLIAVVGENTYTELTDYVIPYAVLTESGVADVVALATKAGPIRMLPSLTLSPQATVDEFDAAHPDGADYVIVPAVHAIEDPALIGWVDAQARKGAAIVGICDGAWVLAHAGLLEGRRATGHWFSFSDLEEKFPGTHWTRDTRYVADGPIVTTTGVTASIPASLALVEAIAGSALARRLADRLGVEDWSAEHRSEDFRLSAGDAWTAASNWLARWSHERIGVPLEPGVDELALALQVDALARTYRSDVVSMSADAAPVLTRRGLIIVPDGTTDATSVDRTVAPRPGDDAARALDETLVDIEHWYGRKTADFVALQLEYPRP